MKTLASGWCPKHDRVFERANRCPECGTALVPLGVGPKAADPHEHRSVVDPEAEEPASVSVRNPWMIRLALAGALVTAFVLGLIFPRNEPDAPQSGTRAASRRLTSTSPVAEAPAGRIRMVTLTQSEDRLTAVFRTISGFADPRLIEGAAVEVSTSDPGGGEGSFSLSEAQVFPNAEGFTITGRLELPGDIVELRIRSVQVRDPRTPEWRADLSSIWPVKGAQPTVLHVTKQLRAVPSGSVLLTALLGWSDRIEAVFELRDVQGAPGTRSEIVGFDMLVSPAGATGNVQGRAIAAIQTEQVSAGQIIARFESVPANAGPVVIRATGLLNFVEGPWTWRLS